MMNIPALKEMTEYDIPSVPDPLYVLVPRRVFLERVDLIPDLQRHHIPVNQMFLRGIAIRANSGAI